MCDGFIGGFISDCSELLINLTIEMEFVQKCSFFCTLHRWKAIQFDIFPSKYCFECKFLIEFRACDHLILYIDHLPLQITISFQKSFLEHWKLCDSATIFREYTVHSVFQPCSTRFTSCRHNPNLYFYCHLWIEHYFSHLIKNGVKMGSTQKRLN